MSSVSCLVKLGLVSSLVFTHNYNYQCNFVNALLSNAPLCCHDVLGRIDYNDDEDDDGIISSIKYCR